MFLLQYSYAGNTWLHVYLHAKSLNHQYLLVQRWMIRSVCAVVFYFPLRSHPFMYFSYVQYPHHVAFSVFYFPSTNRGTYVSIQFSKRRSSSHSYCPPHWTVHARNEFPSVAWLRHVTLSKLKLRFSSSTLFPCVYLVNQVNLLGWSPGLGKSAVSQSIGCSANRRLDTQSQLRNSPSRPN